MANGWTEERKRKQAEAIRRWKPWEKSTGPKTQNGKDRSSLNAIKHGDRSRVWQEYAYALTLNRQFVRQIKKTVLMDRKRLLLTKELLEKRL